MKIFSTNSVLYKFIGRLWDIISLSVLWLLTSLPIITIGASTTALAAISLQMTEDAEGYVAKDYWKAFKANIKMGIPMGIVNLLVIYVVYLDFQLYHAMEAKAMILLIMGIATSVFFFMCFIYVYPLLARYDNSFLETIKNSYRISTKYFLRTLFLAGLLAVEVLLFLWNYTMMLVGLLVGPGLIMFTVAWFANTFFTEIEKENKSE